MSRPRVYLGGAVDKLPDLGIGWRREVAAELEAAGCEPVWPTVELHGTGYGFNDADFAREVWSLAHSGWRLGYGQRPAIDECLRRLANCDAVFVRWCENVGSGTRAEIAYAVAIGLPVVVWIPDGKDAEGRSTRTFYAAQLLRDALGWGPAPFWSYQLPAAVSQAHRLASARVAERERLRQEAGA